jgi:hypothetical protein
MQISQNGNSTHGSLNDPLFAECRKVNEELARAAENGKDISIEAGLFSISMFSEKGEPKNGLEMFKAGKARRLGKNPSHLCAFNNICPQELVSLWGQTRLCGICSYSINHIKHLPAISAMRDRSWEEYDDDKEHYLTFRKRNDISDDEKAKVEQALLWRNFDALGWELRENELLQKAKQIAAGEFVGEFLVERPEEVVAYLENNHIRSDDTDYLLKRLRDCVAFPLTDSRIISAKMDLLARRLLAHEGKTREALAYRNPSTAAADLYSLLHSYQELSGLSHAEVFGLLRTELVEMAISTQAHLGTVKLLGMEDM